MKEKKILKRLGKVPVRSNRLFFFKIFYSPQIAKWKEVDMK